MNFTFLDSNKPLKIDSCNLDVKGIHELIYLKKYVKNLASAINSIKIQIYTIYVNIYL
jgi:hypothetical protein